MSVNVAHLSCSHRQQAMTCAGGFQRMERCMAAMFRHFSRKLSLGFPIVVSESCHRAEVGSLGLRWIFLNMKMPKARARWSKDGASFLRTKVLESPPIQRQRSWNCVTVGVSSMSSCVVDECHSVVRSLPWRAWHPQGADLPPGAQLTRQSRQSMLAKGEGEVRAMQLHDSGIAIMQASGTSSLPRVFR